MSEVNLNELTDTVAKQRAGTSSFLAGQNTQSSDYLKRYTDFINSQEGATAMAGRIGGELGIPTLQANATNLRNLVTNLPGTYSKATTGYDVNANQLNRIVGQKTSEIAPALATAENSLATASAERTARMGFEQTDQAKALLPYQTEKELLNDRLARETTLYSQDNQNELDALISKIQMGVTLSEGEKNRAQELATSERNYNLAKEQLNASSTQIIEIGGRKKLIDTRTGTVIKDLGSSTSGTGTGNVGAYLGTNSYLPSSSNNSNLSSFYEPQDPYKTNYDAANVKLFGQSTQLPANVFNNVNLSRITGLK